MATEFIDFTNSEDFSMRKEELDNTLNWIKHYRDKMGYESYSYIKNMLHAWDFPIPYLSVPKDKLLFRCRPNNGEEYFKKIDDISCRKDILCITNFGRANEPIQSIFYCSDDPLVAILETSKASREDKNFETEIITIGQWQVMEDFNAGNLIVSPYENNIHEINVTVKKTFEHFKKMIETFGAQKEFIELFGFFAKEFQMRTEDSKHYLTTAAFANYVINTKFEDGSELKALIYPSAIFPWQGMNLAVHPNLIKNNTLRLVGVKRLIIKKNSQGQYEPFSEIISKTINYETGEITWP
jgi:hypothetical protein